MEHLRQDGAWSPAAIAARAQHIQLAPRPTPMPPRDYTDQCIETHRDTMVEAVGEAYGLLSFLTAVVGVLANGLGGPRR